MIRNFQIFELILPKANPETLEAFIRVIHQNESAPRRINTSPDRIKRTCGYIEITMGRFV